MRVMRYVGLAIPAMVMAVPALAQSRHDETGRNRQRREGFWIGFGTGAGNEAFDVKGVPGGFSSSEYGPSFYLKLGGTASRQLLLGAELYGWAIQGPVDDRALGSALFIAQWYPSRTGQFFLKGGAGWATAEDGQAGSGNEATGFAFGVGLGYDVRVGRTTSLVPTLDVYHHDYRGFSERVVNIGLGVMFH